MTTSNTLQLKKKFEKHVKYKHEGVRYPCDQCEYAAITAGYLRKHNKNKHECVRYPCKQCDYVFTGASNLKKHIETNKRCQISL